MERNSRKNTKRSSNLHIAKLEEKIEQLDEEIMENATNSGKLAELTQQKEETEEALNEKMDRWVYLNDLAEQIANQ